MDVRALFAAERRVHQDDVEQVGRALKQLAVDFVAAQRVAAPYVGVVYAVQNEVGERHGVDEVFLLAPVESGGAERIQPLGGGGFAQAVLHMLIRLREKAARAACGVVNGFAKRWLDGLDHRANHLSRGEELAAVVVLLAHAQQQPLVGLGQQEYVSRVGGFEAYVVNLVEDVQKIALRVDADAVHRFHDLADDFAARGGVRGVLQPAQMRDERLVDEGEDAAERAGLELGALAAVRRRPVAPPERRIERRRERSAHRLRFLRLQRLALVENPQKQNPRQLRYVLKRGRAVRPPHNVANGMHARVDG